MSINGNRAEIRVPNHLGSVQLLGSDDALTTYMLVDDVQIAPVVTVHRQVWAFSEEAELLSVMEVPDENNILHIEHDVILDKELVPVSLTAGSEKIEIRRLRNLDKNLVMASQVNLLPDEIGEPTLRLAVAGSGCLTSSQMSSNAWEYYNTYAYLSSTSVNNSSACPGRDKPSYLGGAGNYWSVSYSWGGDDTPAEFVQRTSAGIKAGNMPYNSLTWCASGVDCSGYVARVWGFTYKLSTNTIPDHVMPYTPLLETGDVMNYAGSHVMVFLWNASNGINALESTAYQNLDRVAYTYRSWSSLSGYQALRSETRCP